MFGAFRNHNGPAPLEGVVVADATEVAGAAVQQAKAEVTIGAQTALPTPLTPQGFPESIYGPDSVSFLSEDDISLGLAEEPGVLVPAQTTSNRDTVLVEDDVP